MLSDGLLLFLFFFCSFLFSKDTIFTHLDTYHNPSAQCSYCFKSIFTENKPTQPKPRGNTSRFHDMLKCLLKPICIRSRRKKKTITVPEKCSCTTVSHVTLNQSSDSMTFIDLPWIVPPKYHRNTNINGKI